LERNTKSIFNTSSTNIVKKRAESLATPIKFVCDPSTGSKAIQHHSTAKTSDKIFLLNFSDDLEI
jgi:hypothetical protein